MECGEGGLHGCELLPTDRPELPAPEAARQLLNLATAFCRLPADPLASIPPVVKVDSGTEAAECSEGSTMDDVAAHKPERN